MREIALFLTGAVESAREVFLNLWRIHDRPTIIKVAAVWLFSEVGLNTLFLYMDDYTINLAAKRFRL